MPRSRRARTQQTPSFSLGWELEATHGARVTPAGVIRERDGSVHGQGLEYKISEEYVTRIPESLEALRTLTADPDLHVNQSCGFHVHIGMQGRVTPLQRQQWAGNFVLLARAIEEEAFLSVPESRRMNNFCRRWASVNAPVASMRYSASKYSNAGRYQWVNVVEMFRPSGIGTVEIRLLGNTKRYAYLLGWVGACHAMAKSAWVMTQDPSAYTQESAKLRAMFFDIQNRLLRQSNNEQAYGHAVLLAHQHVPALPAQMTTPERLARLLSLADASENARSERIANEARAHVQALAYQLGLDHEEAHRINNQMIRETQHRIREAMAQTIREAQAERTATRTQATRQTVTAVRGLEGFNPDAFTIG